MCQSHDEVNVRFEMDFARFRSFAGVVAFRWRRWLKGCRKLLEDSYHPSGVADLDHPPSYPSHHALVDDWAAKVAGGKRNLDGSECTERGHAGQKHRHRELPA